jgi:hypothetical protein
MIKMTVKYTTSKGIFAATAEFFLIPENGQ